MIIETREVVNHSPLNAIITSVRVLQITAERIESLVEDEMSLKKCLDCSAREHTV